MAASITYEYAEDPNTKGNNQRGLQIWIKGGKGKRLYIGNSEDLASLQIHGEKSGGIKDRAPFYEKFKKACVENWGIPVSGTFEFEYKNYEIKVTRVDDLI